MDVMKGSGITPMEVSKMYEYECNCGRNGCRVCFPKVGSHAYRKSDKNRPGRKKGVVAPTPPQTPGLGESLALMFLQRKQQLA